MEFFSTLWSLTANTREFVQAEWLLVSVLFLVLAAEFVNGWTDAANAIATVVSTHALTPTQAVIMAVVLNTLGTMAGTAVAATIGKSIVDGSILNLYTIGSAMISIVAWSTFAAWKEMPTSESHALVAGLTGAAIASAGLEAVFSEGWIKIFIGIGLSTTLGFIIAAIIASFIRRGCGPTHPHKAKKIFRVLQICSAGAMAFSHGMNDGQKFIGVFALVLVLGNIYPSFQIPYWIILICALTMGAGTAIGGWGIIKTMGMKLTNKYEEMKTWQGFSAETGSFTTIMLASLFGIPLSTTHTITTSIMGSVAQWKDKPEFPYKTLRESSINWYTARNIVLAWILTFPVCGTLAYFAVRFVQMIVNFS